MTDMNNQPAPPAAPAPAAPAAPAGPNAVESMVARYGMSMVMAAAGSLLIIVGDVLFAIFGAYGYSEIVWACAAIVLVTVALGPRLPAVIADNGITVILVAASIAVLLTIREVVNDIAFLSTPGNTNVTWFLGAIAIYGGVVLMALGAWRLMAGRR